MYGDPQLKLPLPNYEPLPFSLGSEIEDLRRIDRDNALKLVPRWRA